MMWRLSLFVPLLLLAGELFVRVFITLPAATLPDQVLGWVYKPHAAIFHTKEGRATNRMNSLGFNDDELPTDGASRIIIAVGDSYTEALQVDRSINFCSIAEKLLPETLIFNAARSGLSPIHYPYIVRRLSEKVRPELIMMIVTSGDLEEIEAGAFAVRRDHEGNISEIRLKEKSQSRSRAIMDPLLTRSALATHLATRFKQVRFTPPFTYTKAAIAGPTRSRAAPSNNADILNFIFSDIQKIAPLRILYLPRLEYLPGSIPRETELSEQTYNTISEVAKQSDIPMITALPELSESYRTHGQPPVGFHNNNILSGHLNDRGHRAIATAVTELLRDN